MDYLPENMQILVDENRDMHISMTTHLPPSPPPLPSSCSVSLRAVLSTVAILATNRTRKRTLSPRMVWIHAIETQSLRTCSAISWNWKAIHPGIKRPLNLSYYAGRCCFSRILRTPSVMVTWLLAVLTILWLCAAWITEDRTVRARASAIAIAASVVSGSPSTAGTAVSRMLRT
jgi:hypothetical protein